MNFDNVDHNIYLGKTVIVSIALNVFASVIHLVDLPTYTEWLLRNMSYMGAIVSVVIGLFINYPKFQARRKELKNKRKTKKHGKPKQDS